MGYIHIYISVKKVTVGCFSIETFRLHGLLNELHFVVICLKKGNKRIHNQHKVNEGVFGKNC